MTTKRQMNSRRRFLKTVGGVGAVAGEMRLGLRDSLASAPVLPASGRPSESIFVGSRRQLLFDDFLIGAGDNLNESLPWGIHWRLGQVEKSPDEMIFRADQPWENETAWISVLHDGGRFRMWYMALRTDEPGGFVSYAESDDGIMWRKPILNLIEKNGSKRNNVVYTGGPGAWHVELGNVFLDPSAKPEARYKMIYPTWLGAPGEDGVLLGASSSDGFHWTRSKTIFLGRYCDSQNVASYDPVLGKYVAYIRWGGARYGALSVGEHPVSGAERGRCVGRIESDDFEYWSSPEFVLKPDFEDGLNVDLYGPAGYGRYEGADNAHFMFPPALLHREGVFLSEVAVSRDNRTWLRPTRETFIPLGQRGSFDETIISACPGFLPAGGDHLAVYYRNMNKAHAGALKEFATGRTAHGMGRAIFKRDRIVGIEAGPEGGGFWTRPLIFEGRKLVVNAEPTGAGAQIRVELVGVGTRSSIPPSWPGGYIEGPGINDAACPNFTFEENIPIAEDGLDSVVTWKGRAEVGEWAGKPVRIFFRARSMRIYAFQFLP